MAYKRKFTENKMASLGLKKTKEGDYDYINPKEATASKYTPVKKNSEIKNI